MSDYNFLKSGSGGDRNFNNDDLANITGMVGLFCENGLKTAALYVDHAKRKIVSVKDIRNGMKLEAMIFCKKDDTLQKTKEFVEEMLQEMDEDDNYEDEFNDLLTDEEEDWTPSKCDCVMCKIINDIDSYWNNWVPETPIEMALKKNIDTIDLD